VTFVVMATLLALVEEAITTGMTDLAPLFGVPVGAACITISANCLDVVRLHRVVVYLPAYATPAGRGGGPPRWWHSLLAVVLPFAFATPVAGVIGALHPACIHFPPIVPGS